MAERVIPAAIAQEAKYYGERARSNRRIYLTMKGIQIVFAAAIPVIGVFTSGDIQRYASSILGALVGVIEAILQLGQYQQNWLLCRATREALRREEVLHLENAGPVGGCCC